MKRLSTLLLSATLAVTMVAPVAAEGVEAKLEGAKTKVEETAKEVKEETKEKTEEVKEEVKEKAEEAKVEAKDLKEKAKEEVKVIKEKVEAKKEVKVEEKAVKKSTQKVTLDGKEVAVYGYNIEGENYFKLRDLAAVLKDTKAKFAVDYKAPEKEAKGQVVLTPGKEYTVLDTDLKDVKAESVATTTNDEVKVTTEIKAQDADVSKEGLVNLEAKAFKIDGNNYYRLKDIAKALNFEVSYNEETKTVELKSEVKEEVKKDEKAEEVKEEAKKEEVKKEEVKEETKKDDKKEEVKKEAVK